MKEIFNLKNASYFYLGVAIAHFANIYWNDWKLYAITVPFILLREFNEFKKN